MNKNYYKNVNKTFKKYFNRNLKEFLDPLSCETFDELIIDINKFIYLLESLQPDLINALSLEDLLLTEYGDEANSLIKRLTLGIRIEESYVEDDKFKLIKKEGV